MKIVPRNLTARAAYVVRGNPVNSRPESGVDNCYPGLEFDQRNLEQHFFPGLYFEFQRTDGAVVGRTIPVNRILQQIGVSNSDFSSDTPYFLWYLYGRAGGAQADLVTCSGKPGVVAWHAVRDLLPGRVAIVIGPGAAATLDPDAARTALQAALGAQDAAQGSLVMRDAAGRPSYAVLSAERAAYLIDGVVDAGTYEPGELTKTMCSPWTFDFRDCLCYYWAANKPDLVESADGAQPFAYYMRADRDTDPPAQDSPTWEGRRDASVSQQSLLQAWHTLPVVIGNRETRPALFLTPDQVVAEITYLATVEHALAVEYLYAMYSLSAGRDEPSAQAGETAARVFAASRGVFAIALDEMRHFLWANQLLAMLNAPPSTERARIIAEAPDPESGRKVFPEGMKRYLNEPFALRPLTPDVLDHFIRIEAPSQAINQGLDGMYVELLQSVRDQPARFAQRDRMIPLLKLLIDEGSAHHRRLVGLRELLAGIAPQDYLRTPASSAPSLLQKHYLDLCDTYYQTVLDAIQISASLGERCGGNLMRGAIRSMHCLDDLAWTLADAGVGLRFTYEARPPEHVGAEDGLARIDERAAQHAQSLDAASAAGASQDGATVQRHKDEGSGLFSTLHDTIVEDAEERRAGASND